MEIVLLDVISDGLALPIAREDRSKITQPLREQ